MEITDVYLIPTLYFAHIVKIKNTENFYYFRKKKMYINIPSIIIKNLNKYIYSLIVDFTHKSINNNISYSRYRIE